MYIAGWNMPGYLPESEPTEFETFDDAKRSIISDMLFYADSLDEEGATEQTHMAEDVNLESVPFTVYAPDGMAYWVEYHEA